MGQGEGIRDPGCGPTNAPVLRLHTTWSSLPCSIRKQIKRGSVIEKRREDCIDIRCMSMQSYRHECTARLAMATPPTIIAPRFSSRCDQSERCLREYDGEWMVLRAGENYGPKTSTDHFPID